MNNLYLQSLPMTLGAAALAAATLAVATADAAPPSPPWFTWTTVVNNNDLMPGAPFDRTFNSYNQPSVNVDGLVVIRARSMRRGGGRSRRPTASTPATWEGPAARESSGSSTGPPRFPSRTT